MDDFDEFLNDLDETVAEDVDWGDDDDSSDDVKVVGASAAEAELYAAVTAVSVGDGGDSSIKHRRDDGDKLDFNAVNAVAKAEVSEAVASLFLIAPETAGPAVPVLVRNQKKERARARERARESEREREREREREKREKRK